MTSENIVISADSHTEVFVDLTDYLPKRFYGEYERGLEVAKFCLERGLGLARNMFAEEQEGVILRGEGIRASSGEREICLRRICKANADGGAHRKN